MIRRAFRAEAAEARLFLFDSDPRLSSLGGPLWRRPKQEERSPFAACVFDRSSGRTHALQVRSLCLRGQFPYRTGAVPDVRWNGLDEGETGRATITDSESSSGGPLTLVEPARRASVRYQRRPPRARRSASRRLQPSRQHPRCGDCAHGKGNVTGHRYLTGFMSG